MTHKRHPFAKALAAASIAAGVVLGATAVTVTVDTLTAESAEALSWRGVACNSSQSNRPFYARDHTGRRFTVHPGECTSRFVSDTAGLWGRVGDDVWVSALVGGGSDLRDGSVYRPLINSITTRRVVVIG